MKKYLFLVLISSFILAGCGGSVANKIEDKVENKVESKLSSLKDLLGMGKEQKCEWSSEIEGNKSSGKLFIKGNKFHQTIVSKLEDQSEETIEVITDGEWTYLWNSKTKDQGMKMRVTEEEKQQNKNLENESLDWGKQFDYKCAPANVSEADLTPPSDVKFMDLEALQNEFKDLIPSIPVENEN
jgi:hypothetical protein